MTTKRVQAIFFLLSLLYLSLLFSCTKSPNLRVAEDPCRLDSILFKLDPDDPYLKYSFGYDEKDRVIQRKTWFGDFVNQTYELTYDENDRLNVWTLFNNTGGKIFEREGLYNSAGDPTGHIMYTWPGGTERLDSVHYRFEPNLVTQTSRTNGVVYERLIYHFENGNMVRREAYYANMLAYIDSIQYGGNDYTSIDFFDKDPYIAKQLTSKNLPVRHISYGVPQGMRVQDDSFIYEFDAEGKLKRRTIKSNLPSPPPGADEREYNYFWKCD